MAQELCGQLPFKEVFLAGMALKILKKLRFSCMQLSEMHMDEK